MKYIEEYEYFINEGYIDVPRPILDIISKVYHKTIVEFKQQNDPKNIDLFVEIYNKNSSKYTNIFDINIILDVDEFTSNYVKDNKDKMTYNDKLEYAMKYGICGGQAEIPLDIEDDYGSITINITPDFIDNIDDLNAQKCLNNVIKHEYGHKMAFDKFHKKNINNPKLDIEKYLSNKYINKNLDKYSPKTVYLKDLNAMYSEIGKMSPQVLKFIKKANDDGYTYEDIIDYKNGPFSKKEYLEFTKDLKNKESKELFIYLLQTELHPIISHDSSKEEFSVDVTSITSELLNHLDIKGAMKTIATASKPNTLSPTFNQYIRVIPLEGLKSLRKMLYLNLQDIQYNINKGLLK